MFWKSYLKSRNFVIPFTIYFISTSLGMTMMLLFAKGPVILLSVIIFVIFTLICMMCLLSYKQQYDAWVPKYYIMYNNDNIKYYFIGYMDAKNGEITFSDEPNDAMLYISMKKINILIEILKNDYSLNEDNITIGQLEYKEAYNKWQTN